MRCIKCGYENLEGLKFCSNCGSELLTEDELSKKKAKKRNKTIVTFIVTLLVIALIACTVSYIIINNKNKEEEKENYEVVDILLGTWNC
jgi:uncharacterized membrane protein YvbJ